MESESEELIVINRDLNLYKRRWFILLSVSLINICNASIWISFAPVTDVTSKYYEISDDAVNMLSTVFFISTVTVGLIAMWIIDRKSLMLGIYIGAILTTIGSLIRALSSATFVIKWFSLSLNSQYILALIGQIISGCAQPFVLFIPTKVAEFWFPEHQRTLATALTGMSNPIGLIVGSVFPPMIVKSSSDIPTLNYIWAIPSLIGLIITIISVRSSKPPQPPSCSAAVICSRPYLHCIKELLTQKAFLVLLLYVGCAIGTFSALITMFEEILHSNDYSDGFSGICISLMIGFGVIGSAIISYYADKTKNFIVSMKVSVGLTALSLIALLIILRYPSLEIGIGTMCSIFGFFGFMTYPLGLELGIECSFPNVPEATSSGMLMLSGQLQGMLYFYSIDQLKKSISNKKYDFSYSLIAQSCIVVLVCSVFILLFNTEYKRLNNEKRSERINEQINYDISNSSAVIS